MNSTAQFSQCAKFVYDGKEMELPPHLVERMNNIFNTTLIPEEIRQNEKIIYGKDFCAKRRAIYDMAKEHDFYVSYLGTSLRVGRSKPNEKTFIRLFKWGFIFGYVKFVLPNKKLFLNCQYIFVLPEHRRQGHITKFINTMKEQYMFINVPTSCKELVNLCLNNGFRPAHAIWGLIENEVEYRWCKHDVSLSELKSLLGYGRLLNEGCTKIPLGFRCRYDGVFVGALL